jgi:hypothetical protein
VDEASFKEVDSLWPDVSRPFSRVVPDGCFLVRAEDDWISGASALRTRTVDFARGASCPELELLLEEAREDAERRGWTPLDDEGRSAEALYELEDVHLMISVARTRLLGRATRVLRVAFHQPWPPDAGAPVETSEMFQNLVRKLLRLGGAPERLTKEVTLDGRVESGFRIDVLRESVLIARDPNISTNLEKIGFAESEGGSWISGTTASPPFDIAARVREIGDRVEVEMTKVRVRS